MPLHVIRMFHPVAHNAEKSIDASFDDLNLLGVWMSKHSTSPFPQAESISPQGKSLTPPSHTSAYFTKGKKKTDTIIRRTIHLMLRAELKKALCGVR
ncbi:hypothetical protein [Dyella subtropica]|uniref:hypothetical protein n=1 Tax=Dyella subtropica TaxID=2992127 RepID=UPI00225269DA|nr:hypothetical protein [Dyella subtropica]